MRYEDVAVPRSAVTCAVCHRLRVSGSLSNAGDVFICAECQTDAKQLIEIQDTIWTGTAEMSDPSVATDEPDDL